MENNSVCFKLNLTVKSMFLDLVNFFKAPFHTSLDNPMDAGIDMCTTTTTTAIVPES